MSTNIETLVDTVKSMNVKELVDAIKKLEEELGVSATPVVAAAAPVAGAGAGAAAVEEKTEFKVTLQEIGSEKIKVIKALRSVSTLSLGDAKKSVEDAPYVVVEGASKDDANKIKEALEAAGAKVTLT